MYLYFPKDLLSSYPEGFSILPAEKVQDNPPRFKVNMDMTPFHHYERDTIQITDKRYIDKESTVEMLSYLLMRYGDGWLVIDNEMDHTTRIGLLPNPVNRGEEQRVYSQNVSSIRTGMGEAQLTLLVLGYLITQDKVTFISRFDFEHMPEFLTPGYKFRLVPGKTLFTEQFEKDNNLDVTSKHLLAQMRRFMSRG